MNKWRLPSSEFTRPIETTLASTQTVFPLLRDWWLWHCVDLRELRIVGQIRGSPLPDFQCDRLHQWHLFVISLEFTLQLPCPGSAIKAIRCFFCGGAGGLRRICRVITRL